MSLFRKAANVTPQGRAATMAYDNRAQANRLASVAKNKNASPKTRSTAKVLAKAKAGDPKAKKVIVKTNERAQAGDPKAQAAMKRLALLEAGSKSRGLNKIYDRGL